MTEEQIAYLREHDIPYSPSIFKWMQWRYPERSNESHFKRYLSYLRLRAYRDFTWEDSERLEEGAKDWVERLMKNDSN